MNLDVFHRPRAARTPLPSTWPRYTSHAKLSETLTDMASAPLFMDLMIDMMNSHEEWRVPGRSVWDACVMTLKRMLHVCYPHGKLDETLLLDAMHFASVARTKTYWNLDDLMSAVKSDGSFPERPETFELHDAMTAVVYINVLKHGATHVVFEDPGDKTVFDTMEYDMDHITACVLGLSTVTGVIIKKHFDVIPKLPPKMIKELHYKPNNNKWSNYLVAVAWVFIIVGHITKSRTRNELVRIIHTAKSLVAEGFILECVRKATPHLMPEFVLFCNLILRLHGAIFRLPDFVAFKATLGSTSAFTIMGCLGEHHDDDHGFYMMHHKFPMTPVDFDIPISKHSVGIAHACVLMTQSFQHLWTFLTVDKAYTKASNLHRVIFVDDVPVPSWCISDQDMKDLRKEEEATKRAVIERDLTEILSS